MPLIPPIPRPRCKAAEDKILAVLASAAADAQGGGSGGVLARLGAAGAADLARYLLLGTGSLANGSQVGVVVCGGVGEWKGGGGQACMQAPAATEQQPHPPRFPAR